MAKSVKDAIAVKKARAADQTSGTTTVAKGFKKKFTKTELESIKLKRRQMKQRLYAAG